jgi:hypothetical protein
MKTIILATATLLGLGAATAYANEGGAEANTWFTELPGVIAQAQTQPAPTAIARNQSGAPTAAFITSSRNGGTWVGANHYEGGANN